MAERGSAGSGSDDESDGAGHELFGGRDRSSEESSETETEAAGPESIEADNSEGDGGPSTGERGPSTEVGGPSTGDGESSTGDGGQSTEDGDRREESAVLDVFGIFHFDRRGKVIRELDTFAAEADAICVEFPDGGIPIRTQLEAFLRVPLYSVGIMTMFFFFQGPMFVLFNRDLAQTELLATRDVAGDRPVHGVDDHPTIQMANAGLRVTIPTWLVYLGIVAFDPVATLATTALVVGGTLVAFTIRQAGYRRSSVTAQLAVWGVFALAVLRGGFVSPWLLLVGTVGLIVLVKRVHTQRNQHMLDRAASLAAEHDYDRMTLVTGQGHVPGLVRDSSEFPISLGAVHRSKWLQSGRTDHDAHPDDVPEDADMNSALRPTPVMGTEDDVVGRRIAASVIDVFGIAFFAAITSILGIGIGQLLPTGLDGTTLAFVGVTAGVIAGTVAYFPALEARFGRTVGKWVVGIVVVSEDGSPCGASGAVLRNLVRPIDAVLFYGLGLGVMMASQHRQRLGDHLASTVVVRTAD